MTTDSDTDPFSKTDVFINCGITFSARLSDIEMLLSLLEKNGAKIHFIRKSFGRLRVSETQPSGDADGN